jgi:hypothetical protein
LLSVGKSAKGFQPKTDEELLAGVRDNILSIRIE